ncbi:hypothetical protein RUND412_004916 [Rhizina undulata]
MGPATATPISSPPTPSPIPSKNPLPLSATQEGQVRDLYYARVRGLCGEEIRQFADCARDRTISATWACRTQRLAMNSCMVANATPENMDAAREEWFRRRLEKKKLMDEKDPAKKQVEVIKGHRRTEEIPREKRAGFQSS